MATLELQGLESLEDAFRRIADIPWNVTEEALDDMAAVAAERIRSTGESMGVRDPESEEHILDKITATKARQTETGGYKDITFKGSRLRNGTRTRNAEIAFINEYGKRSQPARPFIGRAMNENEDAIQAEAEKVIGDWIEAEFQR